jgi:hypothetical protein
MPRHREARRIPVSERICDEVLESLAADAAETAA